MTLFTGINEMSIVWLPIDLSRGQGRKGEALVILICEISVEMQEEQKVCPHSKISGKCEIVSNLFIQRVQERKLSIKVLNFFFSSFLF